MIVTLVSLAACGTKDTEISDFSSLSGTWELDDPGREYIESWRIEGDKALGFATEMSGGDTAFAEEMTVFERPGEGWVLGVRIGNENESSTVFFRLYDAREGYFRFENPSHDFPKRIIYEVVDENRLKATVDDGEKGDRILEFAFIRKKD